MEQLLQSIRKRRGCGRWVEGYLYAKEGGADQLTESALSLIGTWTLMALCYFRSIANQ